MMTPTSNFPQDSHPAGQTVRDIVERTPALVNEVWCRKILRQLLQSLDTQYTNGAPHRLIMPDTIVVQASGDAVLLPDPDANLDFQPEIGADLRALAAVMHFAITHEMPAAGPLMGRGLAGYSDSLLGAIDRCMSPNKPQRPQTVAELRDLLGMVSVGLLKPSAAAPVPAATAAPVAAAVAPAAPLAAKAVDLGPPAPARKWLWIGLAAVLLAGALYVVRQHGAEELVGAPVQAPPAAAPVAPAPVPEAAPAAPGNTPSAETAPAEPAPAEDPAQASTNDAIATAENGPAVTSTAATGNATYRLMIKPWGTIYVDGKRHGVSPPLKRLVLPAGRHTVMLENPGFPDRIVQVDSKRGASGQIAHDFLAASPDAPEPAN